MDINYHSNNLFKFMVRAEYGLLIILVEYNFKSEICVSSAI